MFGYVRTTADDLSEEEKERYSAVYCGLCRMLGQRYGAAARLSLTYEITYLILFLSSLYEPDETCGTFRCGIHPWKESRYIVNEITEYATDMTVALVYHKCLDDWRDDHQRLALVYSKKIAPDYQNVKKLWPNQTAAIESGIQQLSTIEAEKDNSPDAAANCFGQLLSSLFLYREDHWKDTLIQFGYGLGRFLYMMDAVIDRERDAKKGSYNPSLALGRTASEMREPLMLLIGQASVAFERLPLIQDEHLLRNILYSGVWQTYNQMLRQDKKEDKNG